MRYTHAQMSPIFRTTKLATAWSRTYPHGHTLSQLVTNPENHQATAQPSPPPSKGLHGAFKTSPAPYPATLQHSTISSFHSCAQGAEKESQTPQGLGASWRRPGARSTEEPWARQREMHPGTQRLDGPTVLSRGSCGAMLPPAGSQVTGLAATVMRPPGVIYRT